MKDDSIDRCMVKALKDGVFPGAVLRVTCKGERICDKAYGVTDLSNLQAVDTETVFDLASLTKPLAAAPAVMVLVQKGLLTLNTTLGELIPECADKAKKDIAVHHLLCHTSGLPDHKPYFEILKNIPEEQRKERLNALLRDEPLIYEPGSKVVYSDIGFMILNRIIETCSVADIDDFVQQEVYRPLGISDLYYIRKNGSVTKGRTVASTEICPWRGKTLRGEVHDDNAWVMGGCCAHAGLFGTAKAVETLLSEFMAVYHGERGSNVFERPVLRRFLTEWDNLRRTPGFDMPSTEGSSSGHYFSGTSVGHLGFTGTSFWMDLERKIIVVLLTNRVHPSRDNVKIRTFRPLIHDAVMSRIVHDGCVIP